jgi:hypothetical protein
MVTPTIQRSFYYISAFTILLSLGFIFLLTYWAIYPYKILEFGKDNGVILNTTVRSGEYLEMQQDFCKYKDLVSYVNRQFIDTIIYQVPESLNRRPLGCHKKIEYVYVPKALPPGDYYISTTISFEVNPIRKIVKTVKTNSFRIVAD